MRILLTQINASFMVRKCWRNKGKAFYLHPCSLGWLLPLTKRAGIGRFHSSLVKVYNSQHDSWLGKKGLSLWELGSTWKDVGANLHFMQVGQFPTLKGSTWKQLSLKTKDAFSAGFRFFFCLWLFYIFKCFLTEKLIWNTQGWFLNVLGWTFSESIEDGTELIMLDCFLF